MQRTEVADSARFRAVCFISAGLSSTYSQADEHNLTIEGSEVIDHAHMVLYGQWTRRRRINEPRANKLRSAQAVSRPMRLTPVNVSTKLSVHVDTRQMF